MILGEILSFKRKDLDELKRRFPLHKLREAAERTQRQDPRSFKRAFPASKINLICELKKASPSQGVIREDFQPLRIASAFEYAGAAAISILTEPHFFKGRPSYLKTVRQVTSIPILRKDFILESYQIYETVLLEADAYLLIASILTDQELKELIHLGAAFKMDALVEVHTDEDLKKALGAGAKIIGINNRNLQTMEVDPYRAKILVQHIPKDIIAVIESGISRYEEVMEYKSIGINNFLIGTSLMKSEDVVGQIQELLGLGKKWKKDGTLA